MNLWKMKIYLFAVLVSSITMTRPYLYLPLNLIREPQFRYNYKKKYVLNEKFQV